MIQSRPCFTSQRRTSRLRAVTSSLIRTRNSHSMNPICRNLSGRSLYTESPTILSRLITWSLSSRTGSASVCHWGYARTKLVILFLGSVIERLKTLFGSRWRSTSMRRSSDVALSLVKKLNYEQESAWSVGSTCHLPDACRVGEYDRSSTE